MDDESAKAVRVSPSTGVDVVSSPDLLIVANYLAVKKHSWRGKYKRVFSVGELGIQTRNANLEITNAWPYDDDATKGAGEAFGDIMPVPRTDSEFIITLVKKGRKSQQMTFACDQRTELLTAANKFRHVFYDPNRRLKKDASPVYKCKKWRWSEARVDVLLSPGPCSLRQLDPHSQTVLGEYYYKDIQRILLPNDAPGGLVVAYEKQGRLHFFVCDKVDEIVRQIVERARNFLAVDIPIAGRTEEGVWGTSDFLAGRLGTCSDEESMISLSEFPVKKQTNRSSKPVDRLMCVSERCVIERDPASYTIVCSRPLVEVHALVRDETDVQSFVIEYKSGACRRYTSTERDSLLSSLLDSVRAAGNKAVHVRMTATDRGKRIGPLGVLVDEEIESNYLKNIAHYDGSIGYTFAQVLAQFNINVDYNGLTYSQTEDKLFAENKEKLILAALDTLLSYNPDGRKPATSDAKPGAEPMRDQKVKRSVVLALTEQFQALRRLVASKTGFEAFTTMPGFRDRLGKRVIGALKHNNAGVAYAAVDCMAALMQPMHEDYSLANEQSNKSSLLSSKPFLQVLVSLLDHHIRADTGALVINALLEFFTYAVCDPYSDTTSNEHFDTVLDILANTSGRSMFKLFQHPSLALVKGAGQIMKAMIEEGSSKVAKKTQHGALVECALLKHLHTSMFTLGVDLRALTHRELSRHLVSLWTVDNNDAEELMKRILPAGLLSFLDVEGEPPEEIPMPRKDIKAPPVIRPKKITLFDHWKAKLGLRKAVAAPEDNQVVLRRRRQNIKSHQNWLMLYYQINKDHAQADLIWNHYTREELRQKLEDEYRTFIRDKALSGSEEVAWNYLEFEVHYHTLDNEIKIGDHYLRLLLEEGHLRAKVTEEAEEGSKLCGKIHNPVVFFNDLYHRFLLPNTATMRMTCLQAMTVVYEQCKDTIGQFNDTAYMVAIVERTMDKTERDRILLFLEALLTERANAKMFIAGSGVKALVDLMTLAHLHNERAPTAWEASNVIEAGEFVRSSEKEWYYTQAGDTERMGPVGLDEMGKLFDAGKIDGETRVWAQGMDGWRRLSAVGQLKWTLMVKTPGLLNDTELARTCLSLLRKAGDFYPTRDSSGAVMRPLPRIQRVLSESVNLPHIIQMFLTFDPIIVERAASLLTTIALDNPIMPQLFSTGCFLFSLMYTGSNVLPIAKFLHATHMRQAVRNDDIRTLADRSILASLLPTAMICYLENYGPEKFSEIFLGEFDNPEAIWNMEMRKFMIRRIAVHLTEFTPRLKSNTRAPYQYCPMPAVAYPELENELFCNQYYLRHLCDTDRFPDWPIENHVCLLFPEVDLLRDILIEWAREVEKKPPSMTKEDCMALLGLPRNTVYEEQKVRKAYFRMAAKYHPDKNPDGRDMFEKVAEAYEFLVATHRDDVVKDGPDPRRITLIIKAQTILYRRYTEILAPYKYAGYPQLLQTIELEKDDDNLFSKPYPLLPSASELCYYTVHASSLNAEEMRREGGIKTLAATFSRVVSVVSGGSKPDDMPVQVSANLILFFAAAVEFEESRLELRNYRHVLDDIVRCMFYPQVPNLVEASLKCISMLALDSELQNMLLDAGALWFLVHFVFQYDYTLEEGGVERAKESNKQAVLNEHARLAIRALSRLGGYLSGDLETPKNPVIRKCLRGLLTPYLANRLVDEDPTELLKAANSNAESPYLVWNNSTRAELVAHLEEQKELKVKTGDQEPSLGADFDYSQLRDLLKVGDVYIGIYNDNPMFKIDNPNEFAQALMHYIAEEGLGESAGASPAHKNGSASDDGGSPGPDALTMVLSALTNVLHHNQGTEVQLIGHANVLCKLLERKEDSDLGAAALSVIHKMVGNKDCVADVAQTGIVPSLLLAIHAMPNHRELIISILTALAANSKIVLEIKDRGGLLYLLDLFANSSMPDTRTQTAVLFARLGKDKLHGPKINLSVVKFLPRIFMDAWKESPEASVNLFDGMHENPELIWTDGVREKVKSTVRTMKEEWHTTLLHDRSATWRLPDDFENVYQEIEDELAIGGVFIRLYNSQPGWTLREPRQFMIACFEKFIQICGDRSTNSADQIQQLALAITNVLRVNTTMVESVAALGYIPQIIVLLNKLDNLGALQACMGVLVPLAGTVTSVESMGTVNTIAAFKRSTSMCTDIISPMAEALHRMMEKTNLTQPPGAILAQILKEDFLSTLIEMLSRSDVDSSSKARIVKAIKSMQFDNAHGDEVNAKLQSSPVWAKYKDQRHDLFIQNTSIAGYLTGPSGHAGYLTAAPANRPPPPDKPPPIAENNTS